MLREAMEIGSDTLVKLLELAVHAAGRAGVGILENYRKKEINVKMKSDATPLTQADIEAHRTIRHELLVSRIPVLSEEGRLVRFEERRDWDYFWLVDPLDGTLEFINENGEFTVNIALIHRNEPILGVIYLPELRSLYYALQHRGAYLVTNYEPTTSILELGYEYLQSRSVSLPYYDSPGADVGQEGGAALRVLISRSHMAPQLDAYLQRLSAQYPNMKRINRGSSLKLCMVAEGSADLYPRIAKTSEWDTGAGQIIAEEAGVQLVTLKEHERLLYNKSMLENPPFVLVGRGIQLPRL